MTHYQKLAIITFRIIGVFFLSIALFYGLISLVAIIFVYGFNFIIWLNYANFYWLPLIIIGIALIALSKKLGKFVCFGFDKFDE